MSGRSYRILAAGLGGCVATVCAALGWSYISARDVPLSRIHGDCHIGPTWPDRRKIRGDSVSGEMDSLFAYARPGFDPDDVHPNVRDIYERTGDFKMTVSATWHHPFRLGARLASRWTTRMEQLNLPGPDGGPKRVSSELFALAEPAASADPRDDPRLWVRTDDDTDEAVFVAIYASHTEDGERFANIAVPLPGVNLSTVLRMCHRGEGLELTTHCPGGGLYLHTDFGAFRLPASQRFRVSPAHDPAAPSPPAGVDRTEATVLADQHIRFLGSPLVTVRYAVTKA